MLIQSVHDINLTINQQLSFLGGAGNMMLGFQLNLLSTVSTYTKRFVRYLLNPLTVASVTDTEKGFETSASRA